MRSTAVAIPLVLHRISDFAAWRAVYDSVAPLQAAGGVTAESVHRMAGDPDDVLVIHEFSYLTGTSKEDTHLHRGAQNRCEAQDLDRMCRLARRRLVVSAEPVLPRVAIRYDQIRQAA
jgi:hypothetical protein